MGSAAHSSPLPHRRRGRARARPKGWRACVRNTS